MSYYIRILGTSDPDIHVDHLIDALKAHGLHAKFALPENETGNKWTFLDINNASGEELAQVERNATEEGELGYDELEEFKEEILECKPASAVQWLENFFEKVKVVYAFQLLSAAFEESNYEIIDTIRTAIWNKTGGILQADGEGFSNEDGYHILWQFSENVSGDWYCSVIDEKGQWQNFCMDLGDPEQRKEFLQGKVPAKAIR